MNNDLEELFKTIDLRVKSKAKNSYTNKLIKSGPKKIAQKIGEETTELIIDYLKGSKKRTIEESVDLIYHLFVLIRSKKISLDEINKEISKRKKNVRR
tara:strand:- start:1618 stop:1911 length:294 start_codon:yes stop_codon:yes gene_type:complete